MFILLATTLVLISVLSGVESASAMTRIFYVSADGNDSWSGTIPSPTENRDDGPFRSIERARDQIRYERGLGQSYAYTVLLRAGMYELDSTLTFGPEDSGTPDAPVTYMAYGEETPTISGGKKIGGPWQKNADNPLVWDCYLSEVYSGEWYFYNLFVNDNRRNRARWPKKGCFRIQSLLPGANPQSRDDSIAKAGYVYGENHFDPRWKNLSDIDVVTISMWTAPRRRINTLNSESREIIFNQPVSWPYGYWGLNWFYIENVYEKLGPGEWYLDRQSGKLSYWPLPGEDVHSVEFIAPKSPMDLMKCEAGSKYINFIGLSFAYSDCSFSFSDDTHYLRGGTGIAISGENIVIEDCRITKLGGYGIRLQPESKGNTIRNCFIDDLGAGGIDMAGTGSIACNNFIGHGGKIDYGVFALRITAHNDAINNEVCFFPYIGIRSDGKDANVRYNHVHNVMQILSDGAGIYRGPSPGSASIYGNMIHDIGYSSLLKKGGYGIYLDDGAHNVSIMNNIVFKTMSACLHLHHGHSNVVQNNVFAFSETEGLLRRSRWREGESIGWEVERNIFINEGNTEAKREMISHNTEDRRYKFNYNLYFVKENEPLFYGNDFSQWKSSKSLELDSATWNPHGQIRPDRVASGKWEGGNWVDGPLQDQHSLVADPLLRHPEAYDFALMPDSPAFQIGFRPIDVDRIGLQRHTAVCNHTCN